MQESTAPGQEELSNQLTCSYRCFASTRCEHFCPCFLHFFAQTKTNMSERSRRRPRHGEGSRHDSRPSKDLAGSVTGPSGLAIVLRRLRTKDGLEQLRLASSRSSRHFGQPVLDPQKQQPPYGRACCATGDAAAVCELLGMATESTSSPK